MIDSFKKFQAQTTNYPLGIEVTKAEGSYVYGRKKKYLDLKNMSGGSNFVVEQPEPCNGKAW